MKSSSISKCIILAAIILVSLSVVNVRAQNSAYVRSSLLEAFISTSDPHSPIAEWAIDSLPVLYGDNAVIFAWHVNSSAGDDPLATPYADTLAAFYGLKVIPYGFGDRVNGNLFRLSGKTPSWTGESFLRGELKKAPIVDYRLVNAAYDPATHTVSFDIDITPYNKSKMRSDDTTIYATIAALAEDNVVSSQENAGDGGIVPAGTIDDFHHNDVVRIVGGSAIVGDEVTLSTSDTTAHIPVRVHYSMTVDGSWNAAMIRAKSFLQEVYPRNSNQVSPDVLNAGQTGYVTALPAVAPNAVWIVLPNTNSITEKPGVPINIVWSSGGANPPSNVKLEFTTDNGTSWSTITAGTNLSPYSWTIPVSAFGATAMIRVSDPANPGLNGVSVPFPTPAVITVTHPAAGEVLTGGSANYLITFTGANIAPSKTFDYSLDSGVTWANIGFLSSDGLNYNWETVPNTATTKALVRIKDENGAIGISSLFTITGVANLGTFTSIKVDSLVKDSIGNKKPLKISWTYTGDIGDYDTVQVTLNNGIKWTTIPNGIVKTTEAGTAANPVVWTTPDTGYYTDCYVRVISSKNVKIQFPPDNGAPGFKIGAPSLPSGVSFTPESHYSISNFPNPFSNQTTIKFTLPSRSFITIVLRDELGREISRLVSETLDAGSHSISFNAINIAGGVYTYTLEAGGTKLVGKMTVIK